MSGQTVRVNKPKTIGIAQKKPLLLKLLQATALQGKLYERSRGSKSGANAIIDLVTLSFFPLIPFSFSLASLSCSFTFLRPLIRGTLFLISFSSDLSPLELLSLSVCFFLAISSNKIVFLYLSETRRRKQNCLRKLLTFRHEFFHAFSLHFHPFSLAACYLLGGHKYLVCLDH